LKLLIYIIFNKIILIKIYLFKIGNNKGIIFNIFNKINNILINKQFINIKAKI